MTHPARTVVIATLITAAIAPGVLRLQLRTDGLALAPRNSPGVLADRSMRDDHGLVDSFVVVLRAGEAHGIFDPETLQNIRDLTVALAEALPDARVVSLATEPSHRVVPGTLKFRTLLDPLPETRQDGARLREEIHGLRVYDGTLVSNDGQAAALLVGASPERPRLEQYDRIRSVISARSFGAVQADVIGAPAAEALLGIHILEDLGFPSRDGRIAIGLLPLTMALLATTFLIAFRSVPAVLLLLGKAGACLAFVFGTMGWLGIPIYLTTAVIPVLLTVIGITDEVHIVSRYAQVRRERAELDAAGAIRTTMAPIRRPIVFTAITTAIGFASFAASPIEPVRVFGIFMALGVAFGLSWSLVVTPAALALASPEPFRGSPAFFGEEVAMFSGRLSARWRVVLVVALAILFALPFGIRRLEVQDSWVSGFARDSEFAGATRLFDEGFHGTHQLRVRVRSSDGLARPFTSPHVLRRVHDLEEFIRSCDESGVGGVLGPPDLATTTSYLIGGRNEASRAIPEDDRSVELLWGYASRLLGPERLRETITPDFESGLVTVFLKHANYVDTGRLMQEIRAYERDHLQGAGLRIDFGGDVAVSQDLIAAVVTTQIRSLLIAVVGVFVILALLFRSMFWGMLATLPCLAAVALNLAAMGWLGIPLGVATSMFAAMALGLGDSFSIHLVERYRAGVARGAAHADALRESMRSVGPATCLDAVAVGLGFGILIFSRVPANARLGLTTWITVASCVVTTFFLLPPILAARDRWRSPASREHARVS